MNEFHHIKDVLENCFQLPLRQPLSDKQLILLSDAKFQEAGKAVTTEINSNQEFTSTRKTYARVPYGSTAFSHSHRKMYFYAKDFLAVYLVIKAFGHTISGSPKLVTIMTDSKSVIRLFKFKMILPQFTYILACIPHPQNEHCPTPPS